MANKQIDLSDDYKKEISSNEARIETLIQKLEANSKNQKLALKKLLAGKVSEEAYNLTADDLVKEEKELETFITQAQNNITRIKKLLEVDTIESLADKQSNLEEITDDVHRQEIIKETIGKAIMQRVSGTEKIITIIPKHRYRIETGVPTKYIIKRGQACIKILEVWRRVDGKEIAIPFTGKLYERYIKDKQGNYKYNNGMVIEDTTYTE